MVKLLAIILVMLVLVSGAVYYSKNQNSVAQNSVNKINTNTAVASDETLDSDLSALDRDLLGLEQSDTVLTQEVNGL
ncbi:MAG: hypothetical protein PHQ59_03280 [Candidatus Daviesbacteria bacterium]|nr:hypothetical protein [Candidatus Daviesbacteria bacterium]